jgi:hypothetical protein
MKSVATTWLERLEMEAERNDEHFEEVLGRLDSLIRRGQPPTQPPPPPSVSEATIPVLTEVYDGTPVVDAPTEEEIVVSEQEKLELAVAAVLPMMVEVLEEALIREVRPAMEGALKRVLEDLQPQIETMLRQRLQATPAQEVED